MGDPHSLPRPAAGMVAARSDFSGSIRTFVCGQADTAAETPVGEHTLFHLCSMSKLLAAVTLLRLMSRTRLPLETSTSEVLGVPVTEEAGRSPTIRELLSHYGGIADPAGSFSPGPVPKRVPSAEEILSGDTDAHPGPVQISFPPDSRFHYSDAGYCVIERIIELLSGRPFLAAVTEEVMAPLEQPGLSLGPAQEGPAGAEPDRVAQTRFARGHDAYGAVLNGGQIHYPGLAASGLWSDIRQISTVLADLAQSAAGSEGVLLPSDAVGEMISDHGSGAGLGVFTFGSSRPFGVLAQGWGIGFQCQARLDPATGRAVVVVTNSDPGAPQNQSPVGAAIEALTTDGAEG